MQLEALKSLAQAVAAARSPDSVLRDVVQGLAMTEGIALARVWLVVQSPDEPPHLELRASVGASIVSPEKRWNTTDGAHHKLPLSYGKVGRVATTNQPLLLQRGPRDWLLHPDWAEAEQIQSFAGQPLSYRSEVLGVVACFSRRLLQKHDLSWLRVFADHAALAVANARTLDEITRLREIAAAKPNSEHWLDSDSSLGASLVAESPRMKRVLEQVDLVARTDAPVLITGESGVGKELVAASIHASSRRNDQPFIKVNCASIPRELFESEFFGHVRGAFSGALRDRQGRFLAAHGGTLLLDEVGEIPLELQGKLLRVLQDHTFEPVGDDRTRHVDVRILAATNRSLLAEVEAGRFRRDLYYRLNVLPIEVPPLRERREDVLPLAKSFLKTAASRLGMATPALLPAEEAALVAYDFPGNVRELENLIERAVVLGQRSPPPTLPAPSTSAAIEVTELPADPTAHDQVIPEPSFRELERRNIVNALSRCGWQIAGERGAAKLLELSPSTLSYRMKQLGIRRPR
jgi:transcriptional regulator with GAF, ATPase, and Fis domain